MKYLLWIALLVIVLMILRQAQGRRSRRRANVQPAAERMVSCAVCKLNLPVSESVFADGRYYCCAAHRSEAPANHETPPR